MPDRLEAVAEALRATASNEHGFVDPQAAKKLIELADRLAASSQPVSGGPLRDAAGEFLDAYLSAQRDIPADDLERLDEAEHALRAALSRVPADGEEQ